MIEFLFIFLIICIIADFIIRGIAAYHKDIKKEAELEKLSNSTVEISLEEVMDFVKYSDGKYHNKHQLQQSRHRLQ